MKSFKKNQDGGYETADKIGGIIEASFRYDNYLNDFFLILVSEKINIHIHHDTYSCVVLER